MAFQSAIALSQGFGVIGEVALDGPRRAAPGIVKAGTATAADIVVGRAFTIDAADGQYQPGGTGAFGGFLSNPKAYASVGTAAGGPLAPTLTLPAGTVGEFLTEGEMVAYIPEAAAIGALVNFVQATGVLGAGTAGAGETQLTGWEVKRFANAAAGLVIIGPINK